MRKTATNQIASLQFLGTGASSGIPVICCKCPTCISPDPRNRRFRTSVLITLEGKKYLIDAGPDVRLQALTYQIDRVDGLILTHTHYDHIGGIEELRIFNFLQKGSIPCCLSKESLEDVRNLYHYHFREPSKEKNFTAQFDFQPLSHPTGYTNINGLPFHYTSYKQGEMPVLGLRFGDLAYLTDIKTYDDSIFEFLNGVKTLIISALRFTPSMLHFSIDEAIEFAQKVNPEQTYFIHLSHDVEMAHANSLLPEKFFLAYDGLTLNFKL